MRVHKILSKSVIAFFIYFILFGLLSHIVTMSVRHCPLDLFRSLS
jgi:hypothetical protein